MLDDKNKNMILAIVLSVAVLIGWNHFFGVPQQPPRPAATQTTPSTQANGVVLPSPSPREGSPSTPAPATVPGVASGAPAIEPRDVALGRSPRVVIDTPSLSGSLSLRGSRIDDVSLKNYHETVDRSSPRIVLLSPSGSQNPYYAEFGWVGAAGLATPTSDTLWTADSATLSPERPVTLTWDNGAGLVFRRQVSVDDKFLFTIRDSVDNRGTAPATVHPYGLVSRHGKPVTLGYYVLHEGLIGVLGDSGLQEYGYDAVDKEAVIPNQTTRGKVWNAVTGGFLGITDKYWAAAIAPDQAEPYQGSFTSREIAGGRIYQANMLADARTVAPGATAESVQRLFAGAKETSTIDGYKNTLPIKKFDLLIDWGWFYFITKPLFNVLDYFYKMFGNLGSRS
jgi:YidC/Oxa1 family membrane protein insertase